MRREFTEAHKKEVYRLFSLGLTRRQIAIKTGISYGTVVSWLHEIPEEYRQDKKIDGINADRHLCKTCCFRGKRSVNGCNFVWITGKRRGCRVEDCDRYKRGKALSKKIGEGLK